MKKIVLCLLLCILTSCMNEENESVVCSTISHDEKVQIDIEYEYDPYGKIVKISKLVSVMFNEEQLKDKTLQEYYDELVEEDIEGVYYNTQIDDKNNRILSQTVYVLSEYDFETDYYELGDEEYYEDITKLIEEISSLGYYRCK